MTAKPKLVLAFKQDDPIVEKTDASMSLRAQAGPDIVFNNLSPILVDVFSKIAEGCYGEEELSTQIVDQAGHSGLFAYYRFIKFFSENNLLTRTLLVNELPLISVTPISNNFRYKAVLIDRQCRYVLSRFAYCHLVDGHMRVDSPLGFAYATLHDGRAQALLGWLARPVTCAELAELADDVSEEAVYIFLNLLQNAQALSEADEAGVSAEAKSPTLAQWEFQDLLFHSRTRQGRQDQPYGGTYRFLEQFPPLPAVKPPMSDVVVPLFKPDMEALKVEDMPFTAVQEKRKSIRNYGDDPITVEQLGEFLYRVGRVKHIFKGGHDDELSFRPYPAGGAAYELDIYPVVSQCQGLDAAVYQYDPANHQLYKVADNDKNVETLLYIAWATAAKHSKPQVFLGITTRFQRVQWKYQTLAYALVLKNIGVLYQTMYLVATAMGLAPCALGGGDSDIFGSIIGADYYAEALVGEFLLGSQESE